jgi:ParB family chromosome partitioning protein
MALDLSFKELFETAARNETTEGRPRLIPLEQINEDPTQPRRVFSELELAQLADSIRMVGILQPIVVRPDEIAHRYVICMGARRYRAARLIGLDAVPAIIRDVREVDRYAQIIENIQRDDLAAVDIAAFIAAQLEAGEKQSEIARKLGKPRDWVSRFAAVSKMPSFLQAKLSTSSIRAVYELYQAWRVQPQAIEQACSRQESFTDAQARHVAQELRKSALPLGGHQPVEIRSAQAAADSDKPAPKAESLNRSDSCCSSEYLRSPDEGPKARSAVSIMVRHRDRAGRLIIERTALRGVRFAAVLFLETGEIEEAPVSELRIEEVIPC